MSAAKRSIDRLKAAKNLPFTFEVEDSPLRFGSRPLTLKRNWIINHGKSEKIRQKLDVNWTHILLLDHDIEFSPEHVTMLVEAHKPIVSGAYLSACGTGQLEAWTQDFHGLNTGYIDSNTNELFRINGGTGAGFLLVTKEALEKMEYPWFAEYVYTHHDGRRQVFAEDCWFANNAMRNNVEFWLHAGCRVKHFRTIIKEEQVMEQEVQGPRHVTASEKLGNLTMAAQKVNAGFIEHAQWLEGVASQLQQENMALKEENKKLKEEIALLKNPPAPQAEQTA